MKEKLNKIEQLLAQNKFLEAKILTAKSKLPQAVHAAVLATICLKEGNLQEAEVLFLKSLEIEPNNLLAKGNLAQLFVTQKKFKTALPYAESAYKSSPKSENYALNYSSCLAETDKCSQAISVLEPFLDKKSPKKNILLAIASLMRAALKPKEAMVLLEEYSSMFVDDLEYGRAVAETYSEIEPQIASEHFKKASEKMKDSIQLNWNWSFVELRLRNFKLGWNLYESGLSDKIGKVGRPLPAQVKLLPLITDIEKLDKNKWTLFTTEQGIGDQVLFLGCFHDVIKRFPKSVLIGEERMMPILRRSFSDIGVYPYGFANVLAKQGQRINGIFPIGSLQKYYRASIDDYDSNKHTYIRPNQALTDKYKELIAPKLPGKKLIGISWRGGFWDRQVRTKSFEFELFKEFMKNSDYHFISLQYGDVKAENDYARENSLPISFIDGIDFKKDLDAWVALANMCDRIISVSTALVHFMGAAGKRVDIILGDYQAPFIWGLESGPSIAYENVFIHRKDKNQNINEFFSNLAKEIL